MGLQRGQGRDLQGGRERGQHPVRKMVIFSLFWFSLGRWSGLVCSWGWQSGFPSNSAQDPMGDPQVKSLCGLVLLLNLLSDKTVSFEKG